jgi:hypothetical protein
MKNFILTSICLFCISKVCAQNGQIFTTKSKTIKSEELEKVRKEIDSLNKFKIFYEDDNYFISEFCLGEFGGWITFKNKKTESEYICESTCPLLINKFNGKYIITGSLSHMQGFTKVYEITNPLLLKKIDRGEKIMSQKVGHKGAKILVDEIGMTTLFTFEYNNRLFHIASNSKETFVSESENGKFKKLQSLYDKGIYTIVPRIFNSSNSSKIYFDNYTNIKGYIEVDKNNITIYTVN